MKLKSGEQQEKENKSKKIILGLLIFMILMIIVLIVAILLLKQAENSKLKIYIDDVAKNVTTDFIINDEDSNETYFSINRIINYISDYEMINSSYKQFNNDGKQFYIDSKDELAMFEVGSNIIYKSKSKEKLNFDEYKIKDKIIEKNNKYYGTAEAIQVAFNMSIIYNNNNNSIYFYTLSNLVSYYSSYIESYGYVEISKDFATQKAIIKDRIVVKDANGKYRLLSTNNLKTPIGDKYNKLIYIENTEEFIATNDIGTGIISLDGEVKIRLRYDEVGLIDAQNQLYYVVNNEKYGVLGQNGKVLLKAEYEDIGINRNLFPYANVKNDLFLYDNCILLKKDDKWGIADKNGNIILNFEYDQLGYVEYVPTVTQTTQSNKNKTNNVTVINNRSIDNVVVITDIYGIVIGKDDKYGVVDYLGKVIIPCEFDKIYSITNEEKDEFYLESGNRVKKLTSYLEENKIYVQKSNSNQVNETIENAVHYNKTNDVNVVNNNSKLNQAVIIM